MARGRVNVGGAGLKISALLANYVIAAGQTIVAGDLVEFINNEAVKSVESWGQESKPYTPTGMPNGLHSYACEVSDNVILVVDQTTPTTTIRLTAGSINGDSITWGTPVTISSGGTLTMPTLAKLDTNKAMLMCGSGGTLAFAIITVANLVVSYGTFTTTTIYPYTACKPKGASLGTNKVVFAFYGNTSRGGYGIIVSVSGTTITLGAERLLGTVGTGSSVATLDVIDASNVLFAWGRYESGFYQTNARICTVSGNTLTLAGTELNVYASDPSGNIDLVVLNSTKAIIVYNGYVNMILISGTTITKGAGVSLAGESGYRRRIAKVDSNTALAVSGGNTGYGDLVLSVLTTNELGSTLTKIDKPLYKFIKGSVENLIMLVGGKRLFAAVTSGNAVAGMTYAQLEYEIISYAKTIHGVASQNGVGGETKKFYDWRVL